MFSPAYFLFNKRNTLESYGTIQSYGQSSNGSSRELDGNTYIFHFVAEEHKHKAVNGVPYFENVEYLKIITPGNKSWVDRRVREDDRIRLAQQYAAFKRGNSQEAVSGFPIDQWPGLLVSQVAFFKAMNIFTVEQLSMVPDSTLQNFPMGTRELRQRAIDYLAAAKGTAPILELRKENDTLKDQVSLLQKQVADFAAALATMKREPTLTEAAESLLGPIEPVKAKGKK